MHIERKVEITNGNLAKLEDLRRRIQEDYSNAIESTRHKEALNDLVAGMDNEKFLSLWREFEEAARLEPKTTSREISPVKSYLPYMRKYGNSRGLKLVSPDDGNDILG